jgi:hypothetical protein
MYDELREALQTAEEVMRSIGTLGFTGDLDGAPGVANAWMKEYAQLLGRVSMLEQGQSPEERANTIMATAISTARYHLGCRDMAAAGAALDRAAEMLSDSGE